MFPLKQQLPTKALSIVNRIGWTVIVSKTVSSRYNINKKVIVELTFDFIGAKHKKYELNEKMTIELSKNVHA